jgi:hypothetical protein
MKQNEGAFIGNAKIAAHGERGLTLDLIAEE